MLLIFTTNDSKIKDGRYMSADITLYKNDYKLLLEDINGSPVLMQITNIHDVKYSEMSKIFSFKGRLNDSLYSGTEFNIQFINPQRLSIDELNNIIKENDKEHTNYN
jgi:hypothetical protein